MHSVTRRTRVSAEFPLKTWLITCSQCSQHVRHRVGDKNVDVLMWTIRNQNRTRSIYENRTAWVHTCRSKGEVVVGGNPSSSELNVYKNIFYILRKLKKRIDVLVTIVFFLNDVFLYAFIYNDSNDNNNEKTSYFLTFCTG